MNAITGPPAAQRPEPVDPATRAITTLPNDGSRQSQEKDIEAPQPVVREVAVDTPKLPPEEQLRLSIDAETGRVVGKVIDRDTGETLRQMPSDELLNLVAATNKLLGPLYSVDT